MPDLRKALAALADRLELHLNTEVHGKDCQCFDHQVISETRALLAGPVRPAGCICADYNPARKWKVDLSCPIHGYRDPSAPQNTDGLGDRVKDIILEGWTGIIPELAAYIKANRILALLAEAPQDAGWKCKARTANMGANDPQDCSWPTCGCDPYANRVIDALLPAPDALREAAQDALAVLEVGVDPGPHNMATLDGRAAWIDRMTPVRERLRVALRRFPKEGGERP